MNTLIFKENMHHSAYKYGDYLDFDYHVNEFDFPMLHSHSDYWEFTLLTTGSVYNVLNGKKYLHTANTVFFSTTKDSHYIKKADNNPIRYINISVRESKITAILNSFSDNLADEMSNGPHYFSVTEETVDKIESIIFKLNLLSSNQYDKKNKLLCLAILPMLQTYLFNQITPYDEQDQPFEKGWLQSFYSLAEDTFFLTCSVNDLCAKLGYSRMQLNRLFKKQFDKTPHEYLTEYKLRYAKNLLKNTDMRLIDIAMTVGYSSVSRFQSVFKQKYKLTPNKFRQQNKRTSQSDINKSGNT